MLDALPERRFDQWARSNASVDRPSLTSPR